jgi:hypothetical protein
MLHRFHIKRLAVKATATFAKPGLRRVQKARKRVCFRPVAAGLCNPNRGFNRQATRSKPDIQV